MSSGWHTWLLGGATAVVEPADPLGLHRQVGHDEEDAREQLARMPLDLRDDTARLVPTLRLILEVHVEADMLGRATDWAPQPMLDLLLQDGVGGQPDGVEVPRCLQQLVEVGQREGGIGAEELQHSAASPTPARPYLARRCRRGGRQQYVWVAPVLAGCHISLNDTTEGIHVSVLFLGRCAPWPIWDPQVVVKTSERVRSSPCNPDFPNPICPIDFIQVSASPAFSR